jgi:hypothetical protein
MLIDHAEAERMGGLGSGTSTSRPSTIIWPSVAW